MRKEAGRGVSLCLPRSPPLQPLNSTRVERRGSRERCRKSDREEGEAKKKNTPKAEDGRQCAHAIFYRGDRLGGRASERVGRVTGRIEREEGVKERERESLQSVSSPFFFQSCAL